MKIPGRYLVKSADNRTQETHEVLYSDVGLSLWGGIDPVTGVIIDQTHPLHGIHVKNKILCLPSGRGSSTASQVLLELILNNQAPRAIVLRDVDGLISVGALVAQKIFGVSKLDIVQVGVDGYAKLKNSPHTYGTINVDGSVAIGSDPSALLQGDSVGQSNESVVFQESPVEREMLDNAQSEAEEMALQVIFQYAHIVSDNPTYIKVSQAHIDGCTYIGPGGLKFVQKLIKVGGKTVIPTTLNAMSTDRERWKQFGVPETYAKNAIALGDAYLDLGCTFTFTCAPYLLKSAPKMGENIVWGESNAVVYANSVLGARTEKYADYLDILCACTGIVPAVGVHLEENRAPKIIIDASKLTAELQEHDGYDLEAVFPALGHLCGTKSDGKVPLVTGLTPFKEQITNDHLKSFCASFGTTGSSPLIHIDGITAEASTPAIRDKWNLDNVMKTRITMDDLMHTFTVLDSDKSGNESVSLIALGNPHLSVSECREMAELLKEHPEWKKNSNTRVVACMSRELMGQARVSGHIEPLERFGIEFVNDTCWCMLLDPPLIPIDGKAQIMTNSGKYAHYGPGLTQRGFRFGSTVDCLHTAVSGLYPKRESGSASWIKRKAFQADQRRSLYSLTRLAKRFAMK